MVLPTNSSNIHSVTVNPRVDNFGAGFKEVKQTVKNVYDSIIPLTVQKKFSSLKKYCIKIWPAVSSFLNFIKEIIPQLDNIFSIFSNAAEALKGLFAVIRDFAKFLSEYKIISIASVPGTLHDLAMSIYKFVKGIIKKIDFKGMADRILNIIDAAIDLTKLIAVFVGNATFTVVAGFLSAINIVIQGKKIIQSILFHRETFKDRNPLVNPLEETDVKEFKHQLDPRHNRRLCKKVAEIWKAGGEQEKIETFRAIEKRSIQKIACHALKILSAVINVVATTILLVCPPLFPVAFGLFALSSLILLAEFITDKAVAHSWENVIKRNHKALFFNYV